MLLRVCWERQVAVATVVISHEKRQPRQLPGSHKEAVRIKKISLQHTLIDLQNIIYEGQCFAVIEGELPQVMDWPDALAFRNNYGRRVRERFDRRAWPLPTYAAVITTRYAMPHGLRAFCPGDFGEQLEVFVEGTNCLNPRVRLIDHEDVRSEIFDLNNQVALVPNRKKRFFVSRGARPVIEEFAVDSIEEGREIILERLGGTHDVVVVYSQVFGLANVLNIE